MKCPSCGNDEAYVGFNDIDCPSKTCRHFQGRAASLDPNVNASVLPKLPSQPGYYGNMAPMPTLPPVRGYPVATAPVLTVKVVKLQQKQNNVQISFMAGGDPGNPDKEVELHFDVGNGTQVCTLSHPNVVSVTGVDADNATIYTTNWLCTQDGVRPTDKYQITAYIY